jgi:hypothetical protein
VATTSQSPSSRSSGLFSSDGPQVNILPQENRVVVTVFENRSHKCQAGSGRRSTRTCDGPKKRRDWMEKQQLWLSAWNEGNGGNLALHFQYPSD